MDGGLARDRREAKVGRHESKIESIDSAVSYSDIAAKGREASQGARASPGAMCRHTPRRYVMLADP